MKKKGSKSKLSRIEKLFIIISFIFILLSIRIFYIQIIKNKEYLDKSIKQSNIKINLTSNRGEIYDRNNKPLSDREVVRVLMVLKRDFSLNDEKIRLLQEVTKLSQKEIYDEFEGKNDVVEFKIKSIDKIREDKISKMRGVLLVNKKYRYMKSNLLSHTIGYTKKYENVGISGLEKSLDYILKDQKKEYVEAFIDARKNVVPGSFKEFKAKSKKGKNVKLTIDYNLQGNIEKIMDAKKINGSVVVSDVTSGDILGIASRPNFNPLSVYKSLKSSNGELLNKSIQCSYPPGSIFKIVVTLAALEYNVVKEDDKFDCKGYIDTDGLTIRCWKRDGHGSETFKEAFYNSCNPVFVEVGKRLGCKKILDMAKKLGLDGRLDIGLEEEKNCKLPLEKNMHGNDIANLSIGQGNLEVTPLQINQMTQIIANNGVLAKLHLIDSILDEDLSEVTKYEYENDKVVESPFVINRVRYLMNGVTSVGTGKDLKDIKYGCAGKTGSAQSKDKEKLLVHGWFTGYYPQVSPKYAITVFVYDGKSGSGSAVPVFKDIVNSINRQ